MGWKGRGGWQDPFRASLYFLAYPPIKGGADSHDVNYKIVLHYKRRSLRSHNAAVLPKTKETVADEKSGRFEEPDKELMERIETLLGSEDAPDEFRSNLMTKAAAFKLDNPDKEIVVEEVFADLMSTLRRNVFKIVA